MAKVEGRQGSEESGAAGPKPISPGRVMVQEGDTPERLFVRAYGRPPGSEGELRRFIAYALEKLDGFPPAGHEFEVPSFDEMRKIAATASQSTMQTAAEAATRRELPLALLSQIRKTYQQQKSAEQEPGAQRALPPKDQGRDRRQVGVRVRSAAEPGLVVEGKVEPSRQGAAALRAFDAKVARALARPEARRNEEVFVQALFNQRGLAAARLDALEAAGGQEGLRQRLKSVIARAGVANPDAFVQAAEQALADAPVPPSEQERAAAAQDLAARIAALPKGTTLSEKILAATVKEAIGQGLNFGGEKVTEKLVVALKGKMGTSEDLVSLINDCLNAAAAPWVETGVDAAANAYAGERSVQVTAAPAAVTAQERERFRQQVQKWTSVLGSPAEDTMAVAQGISRIIWTHEVPLETLAKLGTHDAQGIFRELLSAPPYSLVPAAAAAKAELITEALARVAGDQFLRTAQAEGVRVIGLAQTQTEQLVADDGQIAVLAQVVNGAPSPARQQLRRKLRLPQDGHVNAAALREAVGALSRAYGELRANLESLGVGRSVADSFAEVEWLLPALAARYGVRLDGSRAADGEQQTLVEMGINENQDLSNALRGIYTVVTSVATVGIGGAAGFEGAAGWLLNFVSGYGVEVGGIVLESYTNP